MEFKVVYGRDKKVMFKTNDPDLVYGYDTIMSMKEAGYTAYMDGKVYKPKKDKVTEEKKFNGNQMTLF